MAKKKKKNKLIPTGKTEIILSIIFIILLITVIILAIIAKDKKEEYKKKTEADIVMALVEKNTNNVLNIDISNLAEKGLKEYSFRIKNYNDKKLNKEVEEYNIALDTNGNDVTLKLYKDKDNTDLLKDNSKLEINNISLSTSKKEETVYTIIIKANKKIEDKKNIKLKVTTTN